MGCLCALFLVGCGSAAGPDHRVVYASIQGNIVQDVASEDSFSVSGSVRVALAWYRQVPGPVPDELAGSRYVMVAQDVETTSSFPARFRLDVTSLPPEEALDGFSPESGMSPKSRRALGVLLAYVDQNGNGRLDFTPSEAPAIEDRLIGFAGEKHGGITVGYDVYYWEGPLPPEGTDFAEAVGVQPGFQLLRSTYDEGQDSHVVVPENLPISTELRLHVVGDPRYSCYLVEPIAGSLPGEGLNVPFTPMVSYCLGNQPLEGGEVNCYGPMQGYLSRRTSQPSAAIASLCGPVVEQCFVVADPSKSLEEPLPDSPPPQWPCPAQ